MTRTIAIHSRGPRARFVLAPLCLACAFASSLASPRAILAAADEEISLRGDVFTLPTQLARDKRREARETGFSYVLGLGAVAGYDSNLYRSPTDEEGSALFGLGAMLETDSRGDGQARFESRVTAETTAYPGNPDAGVVRVEAGARYSRPFGGADLEAGLKAAYRSDDATDIYGEPYAEDYSYLRWEGDAALAWPIGRNHQIRAGARVVLKDYGETTGFVSSDWMQTAFEVRYRLRIGERRFARFQVDAGTQAYRESLSSDASGIESASYPKEEHDFIQARIAYSGSLSDRVDVDLSYTHKELDDQFQGYESYSSDTLRIGFDARFGERTVLAADASLSSREFGAQLGDGGDLLAFNRVTLGATVQRQLSEKLWLTAGGTWYSRDSNLSTGTLYRDYAGALAFAGLSRYF